MKEKHTDMFRYMKNLEKYFTTRVYMQNVWGKEDIEMKKTMFFNSILALLNLNSKCNMEF